MLKRILLALTFLIPALCHAQGGPGLSNFPGLQLVVNAPSGRCTAGSPAQLVMATGTIYTCQSGTWAAISGSSFTTATNAQIPNGINNNAVAAQSQLTVAATPYYYTNSNLASPATFVGSGYQVGTTWRWHLAMGKNANGTGAFSFIIYSGTTGTTSDTAEVTQAWGTAGTAVQDMAVVDVTATITGIVSGTATVYWSIAPIHTSGGATGFASTSVTFYDGTFTFSTATASLIFGLGFEIAAGGTMPTITVAEMNANALNLN